MTVYFYDLSLVLQNYKTFQIAKHLNQTLTGFTEFAVYMCLCICIFIGRHCSSLSETLNLFLTSFLNIM